MGLDQEGRMTKKEGKGGLIMVERSSIKEILMRRDGMSENEARNQIEEARYELDLLIREGRLEEAEEICADYFGLEPDYIDELI